MSHHDRGQDHGTNRDCSLACCDLPPVLPGDSAAEQMQHMAVIRQFRVGLDYVR